MIPSPGVFESDKKLRERGGFPGGSVVKNSPANVGDGDSIPEWEDSLEEMATHSSILAWETTWIEEPGGLRVELDMT